MATLYVTHDGGNQTLYHVPRDEYMRASLVSGTPTYTIIDLTEPESGSERELVASTNTSQDSTSSGLAAAAGPSTTDPTLLQVDDVTGFVEGHRYLVHENGLRELITVARIDTDNNYLYSLHELRHDYTASGTVAGVELSSTFPTGEASDDDELESGGGPYALVWSYTINGKPYLPWDDVWIRRYTRQPYCEPQDVYRVYQPLEARSRGRSNIDESIAMATEDIAADLESAGQKPELLTASTTIRNACAYRAAAHALRGFGTEGDLDLADTFDHRYSRLMRNLLNGQPPERTVDVNHRTSTAPRGGSKHQFDEILKPS